MNKLAMALITALIALFLASTASAKSGVIDEIVVRDVNLGTGTTHFVTTDVNIEFLVRDTNASAAFATYFLDATYSTAKGGTTNKIVDDLNLGTEGETTGYCAVAITNTFKKCQIVWADANIAAISDGNYFIDINVISMFDFNANGLWDNRISDGNHLGDGNMDSNGSYYIDNTAPSCELEDKPGNQFRWVVKNESEPLSKGGTVTFYYRRDNDDSYTSSTTAIMFADQGQEDHYLVGDHEYSCYVTDKVGNTSLTYKNEIRYPKEGSAVSIGGGIAPSVAAIMAGIPQEIAGVPTPLVAIVAVIAYIFLSKGKKKKRRRRR